MEALQRIRHLWEHAVWADARLLDALGPAAAHVPLALSEFTHLLGAAETWLARLQGRAPRTAVWPELTLGEAAALRAETAAAFGAYLSELSRSDLASDVGYTNSAGHSFTSTVGDILVHVALHGQYHRGKVNVLLRQGGFAPAATDYIAFVRGAPAARSGPGA
jgi:uncharacterized damage-inducible protein DinB